MANAPARIVNTERAFAHRADRPKSYRFSGIAGDRNHSFGYHLAPRDLGSGDYSLQTGRDRRGAEQHPGDASAWDLSFGPGDMITVTKRLLAAAKRRDPRMIAVREFCGTLNGYQTYPWDVHGNYSEGINSWDSSHLWHVHISFFRDSTQHQMGLLNDVLCGKARTPGQIITKPTKPNAWPLAPGHYFGPKSGPIKSHGGFYKSERASIRKIQVKLQQAGCAPNRPGWADGIWEAPTTGAMIRWQKKKGLHVSGHCTSNDWKVMFK